MGSKIFWQIEFFWPLRWKKRFFLWKDRWHVTKFSLMKFDYFLPFPFLTTLVFSSLSSIRFLPSLSANNRWIWDLDMVIPYFSDISVASCLTDRFCFSCFLVLLFWFQSSNNFSVCYLPWWIILNYKKIFVILENN